MIYTDEQAADYRESMVVHHVELTILLPTTNSEKSPPGLWDWPTLLDIDSAYVPHVRAYSDLAVVPDPLKGPER